MFCVMCGKENPENATFCQFCGAEIANNKYKNQPLYNTIPIWKVIILLMISFGFYEIVWAYNLWKQGQKKYDKKISPFWRSLFIPITSFELFPLINDYITKISQTDNENTKEDIVVVNTKSLEIKPFHALAFASFYLTFHFLDRVFSRINVETQDFSMIDIIYLIPVIGVYAIIVTIQTKINKFNFKYNMPVKNDKWTWKTTGFVFLCLLIFTIYVFILALSEIQ